MPRGNKTSPRSIEAIERQSEALKFRKAGWTYDAIAKRIGYANPGSAEKAVKAALRKMLHDDAKDVLQLELARLDDMLRGVYHLAEIGNHGAIDRVLRIMERRASYLGIDAPTKITIEGGVTPDKVNEFIRTLIASGYTPSDAFEELIRDFASTDSGADSAR